MLRRLAMLGAAMLAAHQAWSAWSARPLARTPGVLVSSPPLQTMLASAPVIQFDEFVLTPLAQFELDARVLMLARYRWDEEAALAPFDLGLGWGRMSDSAVLARLELSQSARFLLWRWRDAPPIPEDEITRSAANIHVIPANAVVARSIAALRAGQLVHLRGQLVEATRADGFRWRSSLSREDGGNGACELMYVESVSIED
jgi:hypothetical protein